MSEPIVERPLMADYGVPAEAEGALPWSWAEERLVRSRNHWVVTVDTAGRPHAMPVWGVWHDGAYWFSCSPSALKARNIAVNPHVAVMADDTVEVVSVEGRAESVTPTDGVVDAYVTKYWPDEDTTEHAAFIRSHAMFRVAPTKALGIIEREDEFAARATRWRWPH